MELLATIEFSDVIGYVIGFVVGIVMGLIGGGGSVVLPTFVYLLEKDTTLATAYALVLVGITALIGVIPRIKTKEVDFSTALTLGIPILLGTVLVRWYLFHLIPDFVVDDFNEPVLDAAGKKIPYVLFHAGSLAITKRTIVLLVFASVLLLSFASMIGLIGTELKSNVGHDEKRPRSYYVTLVAAGLFIGVLSAFIGAGGGVMIVPFLVVAIGLPMKTVVGTSLTIMAGKSLFGFIGDIVNIGDRIEWGFLSGFAVVMICGILLGSHLRKSVSNERLKKTFAWFILVLAIFIFAIELGLVEYFLGKPVSAAK